MEIPLKFEVELVCERENLITLKREYLVRIFVPCGKSVVYEGFAILGENEEITLRDFR